jgi:hypothetical protein
MDMHYNEFEQYYFLPDNPNGVNVLHNAIPNVDITNLLYIEVLSKKKNRYLQYVMVSKHRHIQSRCRK